MYINRYSLRVHLLYSVKVPQQLLHHFHEAPVQPGVVWIHRFTLHGGKEKEKMDFM